jgi:hypothetical protein
MIRPVSIEVALFLTPFVIYAAFLILTRSQVIHADAWPMRRVAALVIASLVLVVGSFFFLSQFSGAPPGSTYVPAHVQDGKFVPGTTR